LAILAAMRLQTRTVLLASELGKHPLRSISLTHGADHLDARGRSPMCRQSSRPSLGGEAGGRPRVHLSFIFSAPLRSFTMKHASLLSSTVQGNGKRRSGIASPVLARERGFGRSFCCTRGRSLIRKEPRGTGTPSAGSKDAPGAQDTLRYATRTRCPASREHAPVADSIAIGD
jgi:hypothetical protein